MVPLNVVVVSKVAELPTCQNAPSSNPPLIKETDEAGAVIRVLPIWKMKSASELPCASRVRVPVNCALEEKQ